MNQDRPSATKTVNRALQEEGLQDYCIRRGKGYYYVDNRDNSRWDQAPYGPVEGWYATMIEVYRVSDMTIAAWVAAVRRLGGGNRIA
jgi:hypothetical protein